jgi:hypothetical protein
MVLLNKTEPNSNFNYKLTVKVCDQSASGRALLFVFISRVDQLEARVAKNKPIGSIG